MQARVPTLHAAIRAFVLGSFAYLLRELDDSAKKEQLVAIQREIKEAQGLAQPEGERPGASARRPAAPAPPAGAPLPPSMAAPEPAPEPASMKVKRTL